MNTFPEVKDEMAELLGAHEAVFTPRPDEIPPSPLDLLSLAHLRTTDPELALKLATASGQEHDRRTGERQ